ncbi:hypothetical protein [Sphingomonas sp.]|uniref:hypothetical protein n=1 Tax=Sphingomonas sp. TaxID=28214 RepID=UPI003D6D9C48
MRPLHLIMLTAAASLLSAQAPAPKYVEGQIWHYRTRTQDVGSLLKIQKIEPYGPGKVYHLSIAGVHLGAKGIADRLPHIPVSDQTLDASVTTLSDTKQDFPLADTQRGIETWKQAEGGVFTITVSEIVDIVDSQTRSLPQPKS